MAGLLRVGALLALVPAFALGAMIPQSGEQCTISLDCLHGFPATASPLQCANNVCAPTTASTCTSHGDCPPLQACSTSGHCIHGYVGAPCDTRASCGVGLYCEAQKCQKGSQGAPCTPDTALECDDGYTCLLSAGSAQCTAGVETAPCVLDRNCASTLFCDAGRCAPGPRPSVPIFFPWGVPRAALPSPDPMMLPEPTPGAFAPEPSLPPLTAVVGPEPLSVASAVDQPFEFSLVDQPMVTAVPIPPEFPVPSPQAHPAADTHVSLVMQQ